MIHMSSKEYTELTAQRDSISRLLKGPTLKMHRASLEKQLSDIRDRISLAHREQFYGIKKRTTDSTFDYTE